ncbi:TraM recognition domain-containing protein [Bacillus cereus]|uniref:TraD/TraG TraM recognition site domain-containing protein n=1 Tax=Bacillus cereus TaxID=1396 RepID=A0A9X6WXG7_BACCE|nr:TraM recognition domain-containing protein [Bacillus cereus]PFK11210.1 hypothetical protein COI98_23765 [Bacillus cereus]
MLLGSTEVKFEHGSNSNVYVVGSNGTGKNRFYTNINVRQEEEKNIIVIESMKKEAYHATHQTKVEQGYLVLQLDLLSPHFHGMLREVLSQYQHQKFILYIHVNVVESTYQERGEQVQKLLHILIEQQSKKAMHIYFDEYEMYPIPNIDKFLCVTQGYQMGISIIVQYHSQLQQIHGKRIANQVLTNCDRTLFFGTNSMQDAEYFSRMSGYDQMEVFLLQDEIILIDAYYPTQKIPIRNAEFNR